MELTPDQEKAWTAMTSGRNVFIHGAAGTGKTFLIEKYYTFACLKFGKEAVSKTSTTGISALAIGGKTIHSWSGIKLGNESVSTILSTMTHQSRLRWAKAKVLFIDEISMLDPDILDKLNSIGQSIRAKPEFFGNIQVIISGDLLQLPVVRCTRFCYEAESWTLANFITVTLKSIMRQKDPVFQGLLNEIRLGICSDASKQILESRLDCDISKFGIKPTIIFSTNKKVDEVNSEELIKLINEGKQHKIFYSSYLVNNNRSKLSDKKLIDDFRAVSNVPDELTLAVDAQVVVKKNLSSDIVNGSRGVVISVEPLIIRLLDGREIALSVEEFIYSEHAMYHVVKKMIPLKLCWASTVHSCQGSTLDLVSADLGPSIFDYGQAYVVLSRCRTLEGISLTALDVSKIKANQKILDKFYPP